ncbi:T9SS type A sorting domain-containing protein [Hymenobacter glacieicola]|uniref:Secretion system C-terminal sorting domain-containing protein n=1 Tax=Hymenobacter glacieicola TaxID=1562124 RepID=A0ABQ1WMQ9_9BACT|nr:T9SS type A sorting domain-containing protein [Hymenobacter glacieicola]GGG38253.1 hypothetical protein GCM10011378_13190 [Hymenobacter glacieicola]
MRAFLAFLAFFLLVGSSYRAAAQDNSSITGSTVIIDRGSGNETFGGKGGLPSPAFGGANLGTFDITSFTTTLLLNGGTIATTESNPDVINGARLLYRIRLSNSTTNISTGTITLTQTSVNGGTRTFAATTGNVNVLNGLTSGSYTLSVQFAADGSNSISGDDFTISDPPTTFYRASFTVTGTRPTEPPTSTTWTGGKNDNWFDAANWTNGVPNPGKDATIPDFGSGSTVQYPNIYSNAIKPNSTTTTRIQNADGTFRDVVTPVEGYNNTGSGPAQTRDLIMQGSSQAQRSITRLVVGNLEVYRNFSNIQDSFIQRENTTITFAGTDQEISGSASGFVNIVIAGGGTKTLVRNFAVQPGGTLRFTSGILSTNIRDVNTSFVELFPATVAAGVVIPAGRIIGETDATYLRGFVKISQATGINTPQDFGNIGLTLTFAGNDPGVVTVTRNTGENYPSINNGANARPSIRRIFGVRPADQQTNNGGLSATMVFRYLDNETRNLANNNQSLNENNLALFVSTSSGDVFGQLGRDALNTTTNELTKNNVRTFATFTLSEATEPLPVTLTAFDAKRTNQDVVLTWQTIMELNSKGFEVQVSNDGRTFRTLTFIPSVTPNSERLRTYRYEDKEGSKSGMRYYRLRQIDLNGTEHFYGPKIVNFGGAQQSGKVATAFPNPFTDALYLTMDANGASEANLTLVDLTGRVIRQQRVVLSAGSNSVALNNLTDLQPGVYLLRLAKSGNATETIRVVKQ